MGGSAYFTPPYEAIPPETHIIVAHGPAMGHVDGVTGCPCMLEHVARVQPKLFVCGHIHEARGICDGQTDRLGRTLFVNAANAGRSRDGAKQSSISKTKAAAAGGLRAPMVVEV